MPSQSQIGDYKLLELAGEGSFGKVWKARRAGSLQTVAVKLITKHGKNEKDLRNLRQEIEILRKLQHPNVIAMLDAFETKHDFCVVTEFAQGAAAGRLLGGGAALLRLLLLPWRGKGWGSTAAATAAAVLAHKAPCRRAPCRRPIPTPRRAQARHVAPPPPPRRAVPHP
jgi:hypothetical protein